MSLSINLGMHCHAPCSGPAPSDTRFCMSKNCWAKPKVINSTISSKIKVLWDQWRKKVNISMQSNTFFHVFNPSMTLSVFFSFLLFPAGIWKTPFRKKWEVLERLLFTLMTITKSYFYHGNSKKSLNDQYMEIVIVIFVDSP